MSDELCWAVTVIESERGWGQRVDDVMEFDTEQEAQEYVYAFNADNIADSTPDWYMYAETPRMAKRRK